MKTLFTTLACFLISMGGYAQKFSNISVEQSDGGGNFVIKYDLIGTTCMNLYTVEISVVGGNRRKHLISKPAASGNIGPNQTAGNRKTVYWDVSSSGFDVEGEIKFEFNAIPLLGNDDIEWQNSTSANTCEAYTSYLNRFPNGCFKDQALKKKEELCNK